MQIRPNRVVAAVLVAYVAGLLYLTLLIPFSYGPGDRLNLVPFKMMADDYRAGGSRFVVNFLGNIGVFGPIGLALPIVLGPRFGAVRVTLIGMALSLSIEVAQWISGYRVADVDDVILNTVGTALGYASFAIGRALLRRRTSRQA